jgi:hypothetical protein
MLFHLFLAIYYRKIVPSTSVPKYRLFHKELNTTASMMKADAPGGGSAGNFQAPKKGGGEIKANSYSLVHTVSFYP